MSVEAISKFEVPHVTRIVQFSDGDKTSVRVTHKHFKGENGKDIIRDSCDIRNPDNKDLDKLLNNLGHGYGKSPESDSFKKVLTFINGIEKGEVKELEAEKKKANEHPADAVISKELEVKTDPKTEIKAESEVAKPKQGMTITPDEMKSAIANMRQDLHNKDKQ